MGLFFHHYDKCKHGFVTHLIIKVLEMSCKLDRWMVDVTIRDVLGVKYDERGWNVIMLLMCMCKCVSVIVSVSNYACVHMHTCVRVDEEV